MALAAVIPLFLLFILYILKFLETGMDWNFTRLGVYPMEQRGVFGIFAHPLVHSSFKHLFANTIPLFFLMWCLFYFYRHIAPYIFFAIWIGCGALTFLIGNRDGISEPAASYTDWLFFCSSAAFCANMYRLSPFHC